MQPKCDLPLSVRGRRRMCRTSQAERCRPLHERLRASALRPQPKSELFNLIISSYRIALQKERKQWRPLHSPAARRFARPLRALEPPSDLIPPPVQCGDYCALRAMVIIRLRPHMAGLRPAGSHCEKSGKIPTLHCIPSGTTNPVILRRKSKPIPTQASPPASPRKQRRKRPCPIGFRHICPKTEK